MELTCPACKNKTLVSLTVNQDVLYKCPQCHGLWFDNRELRDIEELPESELMNDFQDQLDSADVSLGKGAKDRLCPRCRKTMNNYQYDMSSGIWVQSCPDAEGVWLDKGEVIKIHQHLAQSAKNLTPERQQALLMQLQQNKIDEEKKEDAAVMSIFGSHQGSKALPLWHVMDGVGRFVCHTMLKTGALDD